MGAVGREASRGYFIVRGQGRPLWNKYKDLEAGINLMSGREGQLGWQPSVAGAEGEGGE